MTLKFDLDKRTLRKTDDDLQLRRMEVVVDDAYPTKVTLVRGTASQSSLSGVLDFTLHPFMDYNTLLHTVTLNVSGGTTSGVVSFPAGVLPFETVPRSALSQRLSLLVTFAGSSLEVTANPVTLIFLRHA
jgi:hypothetical protein